MVYDLKGIAIANPKWDLRRYTTAMGVIWPCRYRSNSGFTKYFWLISAQTEVLMILLFMTGLGAVVMNSRYLRSRPKGPCLWQATCLTYKWHSLKHICKRGFTRSTVFVYRGNSFCDSWSSEIQPRDISVI